MPQLVDYGNVVSSMHTTIVTVWFLQVEINGVKVEFINNNSLTCSAQFVGSPLILFLSLNIHVRS